MDVAQRYQAQLERIKTSVRQTHDYFKPNYDRYNEFRRFVFESSLKEEDINLLMTLGKPQLEFNVLEAYISRLLGEFSKQEPSIEVCSDNEKDADPAMVEVVDQHLRHILFDSKNHHTKYEVYKDLLSGGFSVMKVKTDFANSMSFKQCIEFERAYDPTLCGFDPLAKDSHKGDGRFCFELYPMSKDDFKREYPDISLEQVNFHRDFAGFNWAYTNNTAEILIVADFYEKKKKRIKIVELQDGRVMTMKDYEELLSSWTDFTQPPALIGKPRTTEIETICRYRLMDNKVLEYTETDFTFFPLVFVDGSSILIKNHNNGNVRQVTRPYVYHAKGAQRLKNFAGIALANEIENTIQHKFMVAKEALPKEQEFLEAYKDVQKASVVVYNSFYEEDPDKPIANPIREIQRASAPAEIINGFQGADSLIQNILGSYDASLGINNNQLSGMAIVEAASQSNAAAMPYIVGFLQGLQRVAQIIVNLIPKYYTTPRTIPVVDKEGKKSYTKINQKDGSGVQMFYDENDLNVKVEAGVNFQVQKSRALQQIIGMMQASKPFADFMNQKGLPVLLDNVEIRGIDQIKQMANEWMKEVAQQKQMEIQMQQQAMQNNPMMIKSQIEMAKVKQKGEESQAKIMLDMAKLQQAEKKMMADLEENQQTSAVQMVKADTERFVHTLDAKMKVMDQSHRHAKETIETHHKISQPKKGGSHE